MERSQNFYGFFVVYRYECVDVIVISSAFVVFIQTCLRAHSALHRFSAMITNYFDLFNCILHRLLLLSLHVTRLVLVVIDLAKFTSINLRCLCRIS